MFFITTVAIFLNYNCFYHHSYLLFVYFADAAKRLETDDWNQRQSHVSGFVLYLKEYFFRNDDDDDDVGFNVLRCWADIIIRDKNLKHSK